MNIVINPQYSHLNDYISRLPELFDEGRLIYSARNVLREFTWEGIDVVVKKYKVPIFINRIAYGLIRKSKAHRSYEYALRLLDMHIRTPQPIAYIEEYSCGLLTDSYLVTTKEPFPHMMRKFHTDASLTPESRPILNAFAAYTLHLHERGVLHHDYSPGNIAFNENGEGIEFSLFDINRMSFGNISPRKRLSNFCRLTPSEKVLSYIVGEYARLNGWNTEYALKIALKAQSQFFKRANRRTEKRNKRAKKNM